MVTFPIVGGLAGTPSSLGIDEHGRDVLAFDVLAFIDGDVPAELTFHDDATLRGAASSIRRFHDLSAEPGSPAIAAPARKLHHQSPGLNKWSVIVSD